MPRLRACVAVALGSFASFAAAPLAAQTAVVDIGTLGTVPNQSSALRRVNDRNQAAGWSEVNGFDTERAILWEDGELVDLGVLPGDTASFAWSINQRRQVAGVSVDHLTFRAHAFRWDDGVMTALTVPGAESCYAFDISDRGDVAGACDRDAIVWTAEGTAVRLPPPDGYTWGAASVVNDAGTVGGTVHDGSGRQQPARWRHGVATLLPLPPGATSGAMNGINARGLLVGYVQTAFGQEPALWDGDRVLPLAGEWGALQGVAWGINERGEVAVHGWASPAGGSAGYVWRAGVFLLLDPLGSPQAINNRGVVVGTLGTDSGAHGAIWPKALTRVPVDGAGR